MQPTSYRQGPKVPEEEPGVSAKLGSALDCSSELGVSERESGTSSDHHGNHNGKLKKKSAFFEGRKCLSLSLGA